MRSSFLYLFVPALLLAQSAPDGQHIFATTCASCHGADGKGGEFAGSLIERVRGNPDAAIATIVRNGLPGGMPGFKLNNQEMSALIAHLRMLAPVGRTPVVQRANVKLTSGDSLEGIVVHRGFDDLQLRTADGALKLLRRAGEDAYRSVTSETDWTSYDGQTSGNRYSTLAQIDRSNASHLALSWMYTMPDTTPLETTPIVAGGIMYVTSANQVHALDAGNGRPLWSFQRPITKGLVGNAVNGINRGVALAGDRIFFATDHAHLLALNRYTGAVVWEKEIADWHQNYSVTAAPLALGGLVVTGMAGGDAGARGFVAAFDQTTGAERWRFWTAPRPGEPGSETWQGQAIEHPAAATWLSGSYDPDLETIYWSTGNPGEDHNGDRRIGDNLYSCSVVALDAKSGELNWHYQFTPHDVWDWDAQEPLTLIDAEWQGRLRKLLIQANRNGFFYVLDRTDGKLLRATQFVNQVTWARGIGADGRPVLNPNQEPNPTGVRVCPSLIGAANWWSTAFLPQTGLYYVQTLESCSIYTKRPSEWEAGKVYMGGTTRNSETDPPQKILRALDLKTGKAAWEVPQTGPGTARGGILATAGGVVFYCDDGDGFSALDAATGKLLWRFPTNQFWRASPMTYEFDHHQFIAVANGPNILAFGLPE